MKSDRVFLFFTDRKEWRSWLDEHHAAATEAWIQIQKKDSPEPGISLDEAVEEALCYGWIDSTLNTRDDHSYLLRFSPRKPAGVWAISNIQRVETLIEAGQMQEAGLAAVQAGKESGEWQAALDRENPDYIPLGLKETLDADPAAWQVYQNLPESTRKRYVYWLQSAKKMETKQKRISEILSQLREQG